VALSETRHISVLIVDDEDDIRMLMRMVIQGAGDDLAVAGEAADGREALEIFERDEVDVVVLDQRMPGLSGIDTAIKMLEMRPRQKIVMCSAFLDTELRREAEAHGIAKAIGKRDIDRLPQVLRELFSA
jgi:YesN/AraC family two-component response regulator